jgi:predicted phage terminase large subunit-like protein
VLYTRRTPDAGIIVVQTRWHYDDLAGWLLREHPEENWDILNLPAIADADEGWRKAGDPLWPERFDLAELEATKKILGTAGWSALYQQRPVPEEGAIFKLEWWQRYDEAPEFDQIIFSADTAFKAGASNDYSVITVWGVAKNGFYLLHLWRARAEFPQLKRQLETMAAEWHPNVVLIEDKASGQSLIQELKQSGRLPIRPVKVDADKVTRAHAVAPLVEAGRVFLPKSAPWVADFLQEVSIFPAGPHDDQVDSVTQALNYLRSNGQSYGLLEVYKRLQAGVPEVVQQFTAPHKPAAKLPEATAPTCPNCTDAFIQKVRNSYRCSGCGLQFDWPPRPPEPIDPGQVRRF